MGKRRNVSSSSDDEGEAFLAHRSKPKMGAAVSKLLQLSDGPSARANASFCWCPTIQQVVLFGGEYYDGQHSRFFDELYVFDPKSRSWHQVQCSRMPGPRSSHQMVWDGIGRFWMFGGELSTRKESRFMHYRELWSLDPTTWQWELHEVHPSPSARSGHRMALWGEQIYLFGGFFDAGNGQPQYLDDLWSFDPKSLKWTRLDSPLLQASRPTARSAFVFLSSPTGLTLFGGYCKEQGAGEGKVLHDLWLLKLDDGQPRWDRRKAQGITARSGCTGAVIGDRSIFYGGVQDDLISDEFIQGSCLADCHELKGHRFHLLQLAEELCPRYNAMITAISDTQALLFGGIWECGDDQYTLSDLHFLTLQSDDRISLQVIRPEPSEARSWRTLKPLDDSSDNEDSENSSDSEDSEDTSDSSDSDSDNSEICASGLTIDQPSKKGCKTLKEYFEKHLDLWMHRATGMYPDVTEKELRSKAFAMAKQIWDQLTLADGLGSL